MKTEILAARDDADPHWCARAAQLLRNDECIAIPTETVYGLAANATSSAAVRRVFAAKGRPSDNPLIVHVSSLEMLHAFLFPDSPGKAPGDNAWLPVVYRAAIAQCWPGPLTLLFPAPPKLPAELTAGQPLVAVRMPAHPIARRLIAECGFPLAAPSANVSGRPSPTSAAHVLADLNGRIPCIVDGGQCDSGVESTIVNGLADPPLLLRPGGVPAETLRRLSGLEHLLVFKNAGAAAPADIPTTPGMRYRHYSPNAAVHLLPYSDGSPATLAGHFQAALGPGMSPEHVAIYPVSLSVSECAALEQSLGVEVLALADGVGGSAEITREAAQRLFALLREADTRHLTAVYIESVPLDGAGLAVMNRLTKAASVAECAPVK